MALLCSSMVLSLVSTPVSAAETGQLTNPPISTEGPGSPESASGNEAAAVLNGLYAALPVANGVKEVATAEELTAALENRANDTVKLMANITINTTLTINRTVTLDLNGCVLKMTAAAIIVDIITATACNNSTEDGFRAVIVQLPHVNVPGPIFTLRVKFVLCGWVAVLNR